MKDQLIILNICLSDIPKENRILASNNKYYTDIAIEPLREVDNKGNDARVYMAQSKDERKAKKDKVHIGRGKTYNFEPRPSRPSIDELQINTQDESESGDLPF